MNKESLIIKFEGQEHQIDANTLINTLIHYNILIDEINKYTGIGERNIELKVNALERGSFIIDIQLVESLRDVVTNLFKSENIHYAASIITILTAVLGVYVKKKGRKVEEDDEDVELVVKDMNNSNNIKTNKGTVINIYNNQIIRSSISKSIETASNDVAVEGISIKSAKSEIVNIDKTQFEELIYDNFDSEISDKSIRKIIVPDVKLTIITLSFEVKSNWVFIYDGIRIRMPMKDSVLWNEINNGLLLGKGDAIKVDLEITQERNETYDVYENKKYRIDKFKEKISKEENFQ